MYCSNCGKQIPEQSAFCNYCGNKILPTSTNEDQLHRVEENNNQLLFSYKPQFQSEYILKKLIPMFLFLSFIFSLVFTIIRGLNSDPFSDASPFQIGNIIMGVFLSFLLCIGIGYNVIKKRYDKSVFLFYLDHLEYIDGYFNYNKKQIYYKNILEISMNQNIFQRKYGIGSIVLTTSGISYRNNQAYSNGIVVFDIPNIENVYQELKNIIK